MWAYDPQDDMWAYDPQDDTRGLTPAKKSAIRRQILPHPIEVDENAVCLRPATR